MAPKWIETATDWQSKCAGVKERGAHLLRSGQLADCEFLVGPNQELFKAHRLTLASASPTFEAMLFGSIAEKNNTITVSDLQPDTFRVLLEYIYTDNLNLDSSEMAYDMCYGSQKYLMPELFKQCVLYLINNLAPENVGFTFEFAELMEENNLAEHCIEMIRIKAKEVLRHESFRKLKLDTVVKIFSLDPLNIDSELDLFDTVKCYSNAQENNGKDEYEETNLTIRDAIKKIRFLTLESPTFAVTRYAGLLTDSEALAISFNIACSDTRRPIPADFSNSRIPRNGINTGIFDKNRTEGRFKTVVNNITNTKKMICSDIFYVRNLPFQLSTKCRQPHLIVFLDCNNDESTTWSCHVNAKCRLVSHKVDKPPYTKEISYLFENKEKMKFSFPAVVFDNVLSPEKGYVKDDAVTLEVYVKTGEVIRPT